MHGALCVVSHEAAGDAYVASAGGLPVLSGFVVSAGKVLAVLKNEGVAGMDVAPGMHPCDHKRRWHAVASNK